MREVGGLLKSLIGGISGSGNVVTRDVPVADFESVEIGSAFRGRLTVGPSPSLRLRFDDNIEPYIDAAVHGRTLVIRLVSGVSVRNANLEAEIEATSLRTIRLSGAARLSVSGELTSSDLSVALSGASRMDGDVNSPATGFRLSGASKLRGRLIAKTVELRLSGASNIELAGVADEIQIDGSGASTAGLSDLSVSVGAIRLSGASKAEMTLLETASARLSGAARLKYRGSARFEEVAVSGGSTITRI